MAEKTKQKKHSKRGRLTDSSSVLSELRSGLRIDRFNLDEDVERQPVLFFEVAEAAAMARSRQDASKDAIGQVESQLDARVRGEAAQAEERVTENEIKARVHLHPDRLEAVRKHLRRKLETERLDQLRDSFKQRSYMLRELAALYVSSYYEKASVSGTRTRIRDARAERSQRVMGEKKHARRRLKD